MGSALVACDSSAPPHAALLALTASACETAKNAVNLAIGVLASGRSERCEAIHACEKKLDRLDQEFDENVGPVIARLDADQVREVLACVKSMVDLERIGDLISGFASRAKIVGPGISPQDSRDMIEMASTLEQMISSAQHSFFERDLDRAIRVLRADGEIDRLRNLIYIRHLENHDGIAGPDSINIIFMAQAIERAGDHAKNIAEEAFHLISGHSIRHSSKHNSKSEEQMFLEYLKKQPLFPLK